MKKILPQPLRAVGRSEFTPPPHPTLQPAVSTSGEAFARATLGFAAGLVFCSSLLAVETSGFVKREIFRAPGTGNPNGNPPTFANPNYPNNPDAVTFVDSFAVPGTADPNVEDFLTKLSGFITPAVSGNYVFFFSSDDAGAFYLSTDETPANLKLVAQETTWSNFAQWRTSGGGSSVNDKRSDLFAGTTWPGGATIALVGGKKYYAEAFGKEGGGGDNTGVTMILAGEVTDEFPADSDPSTLTGSVISVDAPTALSFIKQPVSQTVFEGRPVTFSATAVTPPGDPVQDNTKVVPDVTYQWSKNGVVIPPTDADGDGISDVGSSDTSTYIIANALATDNGAKFTCKVTTPGGLTKVTDEAVLTVSTDNVPPTFTAAGGSGYAPTTRTTMTVTYSEAMDAASISSAGSYKLSGGVTVSAVVVSSSSEVVLTTSDQPSTDLTLTVTGAKDVVGNALTPNTATVPALAFTTGKLDVALWFENTNDPDAFRADDLINKPRNWANTLAEFNFPQTSPNRENFVSVVSGWFVAPESGNYVFFTSGDDHGSLWLSTDESPANIKLIAQETTWSNGQNWATSDNADAPLPPKRSDEFEGTEWPTGNTITLVKDNKYYIESIYHEGGGGDANTATYIMAGAGNPANGSTALKGAVIGTWAVPSVVVDPTVSSSWVDGVLTLTFTGTLQSTPDLRTTAPADVPGATSPYTVPLTAAASYFRSRN